MAEARDLTADDYAEMLRTDKRKKEEAEKQKKKRKEERERRKRICRVNVINEGEVAGVLLVMESSESETGSLQAESDSLILKLQFVHLRTCNQVQVDPVAAARCLHVFFDSDSDRMMVFCVLYAMKIVL